MLPMHLWFFLLLFHPVIQYTYILYCMWLYAVVLWKYFCKTCGFPWMLVVQVDVFAELGTHSQQLSRPPDHVVRPTTFRRQIIFFLLVKEALHYSFRNAKTLARAQLYLCTFRRAIDAIDVLYKYMVNVCMRVLKA